MSTTYLALLSQSSSVNFDEIREVAYVLQRQLTEEFTPIWGQSAIVTPAKTIQEVPFGTAPIIVRDTVGGPSDFGFHQVAAYNPNTTADDRPFAFVEYQKGIWSFDASHECLELIMDPYGKGLLRGPDPVGQGAMVDYLVEICDPCGRRAAAYYLPGTTWPVSDFVTPDYYHAASGTSGWFTAKRRLSQPRALQAGGYVSWCVPDPARPRGEGAWYITEYSGQGSPHTTAIQKPQIYYSRSLREWIDHESRGFVHRDAACPETIAALRGVAKEGQKRRRNMARLQGAETALWKDTIKAACGTLRPRKKPSARLRKES